MDGRELQVNGRPTACPAVPTVARLLAEMGLADKRVAVERNGEIVPRSAHPHTPVAPGDRLEIVAAVGGG